MHWRELTRREDALGILVKTLEDGWSSQHGTGFQVSRGVGGSGQLWKLHQLPSMITVADPLASVRRYVRPKPFLFGRWRSMAPQAADWLVSHTPLRRWTSPPLFRVTPSVPAAEQVVVLPGNRRVRLLDFGRMRSRILLKDGFRSDIVVAELKARSGDGPFPAITESDPAGQWFEEELVDGWPLPRAPLTNVRPIEACALRALDRWHQTSAHEVPGDVYANTLRRTVHEQVSAVATRFGCTTESDHLDRFADIVATAIAIELSMTHGDFQPGNILATRRDRGVVIVDWEHAAERFRQYDELVYKLGLRRGGSIGDRVAQFVTGVDGQEWSSACGHLQRRTLAAALVLEDLAWFCRQAIGGPFAVVGAGLRAWFDALRPDGPLVRVLLQ